MNARSKRGDKSSRSLILRLAAPVMAAGALLLSLGIYLYGHGQVAAQAAGWEEIGSGSASGGGISVNGGNSWNPSLAIGADGNPVVAWEDDSSGNWQIYVKRWNGAAWSGVGSGSASGGGISANGGNSWNPSLALGADGNPIVAWEDDSSGDSEIYVKRWSGSAWVEMGSGSASGGGISANNGESWNASLAVAPDGTPVIAWEDDSDGDAEIYVRLWNGSAWVEIGNGSASGGGISANDGLSWEPSLAVGPDNSPIVAWMDDADGEPEIYVRRWNGSTWAEMGSGSASGGGISNNNGLSFAPSLAVGDDGVPVVAWEDDSGGAPQIYVRLWNGTSWAELGPGSASGGGVSKSSGASTLPSLAIGKDNNPVVSWEDTSSGVSQIYSRGWSGSFWGELGSSSASGSGVSGNTGGSFEPSLACNPDGNPLAAWTDDSSGSWQIYLRRSRINSPPQPDTLVTFLPVVIK